MKAVQAAGYGGKDDGMICQLCGEWFAKLNEINLCETCNDEAKAAVQAISDLIESGHTEHCAARLVWGDGECECGLNKEQS